MSEIVRDGKRIEQATVFVPFGKVKTFITRFEKYANETTKSGEPKNREMVDRIASIRRATVQALWTDDPADFPQAESVAWWEIWLRRQDGGEVERLEAIGRSQDGVVVAARKLVMEDRTVTLVRATPEQLAHSLDMLNDIAELRRPNARLGTFAELTPAQQGLAAKDLRDRTSGPTGDAPAVCVLDTGINRLHPMLAPALAEGDVHACDASWGRADHHGHGTEMGGLALYGDLGPVLADGAPVVLRHRLESVKILPPPGKPTNEPDLYGAITAEASSLPEIEAPTRRRCFSMAVTDRSTGRRGRPTSWSAAIDALAAGRTFDSSSNGLVYLDYEEKNARRLFIVSARNVDPDAIGPDHLALSDTQPIHDPAQAWNALIVGACTDLTNVDPADGTWAGWRALAPPGELSPFSATSLLFEEDWPIKPDVVFEGGNVACSPAGTEVDFPVPSLSVLSTFWKPADKLFVDSCATSAATAQVARIAGLILADYPDLWPETVRALIVHSARWTRRCSRTSTGAEGGQTADAQALRLRCSRRRPSLVEREKRGNVGGPGRHLPVRGRRNGRDEPAPSSLADGGVAIARRVAGDPARDAVVLRGAESGQTRFQGPLRLRLPWASVRGPASEAGRHNVSQEAQQAGAGRRGEEEAEGRIRLRGLVPRDGHPDQGLRAIGHLAGHGRGTRRSRHDRGVSGERLVDEAAEAGPQQVRRPLLPSSPSRPRRSTLTSDTDRRDGRHPGRTGRDAEPRPRRGRSLRPATGRGSSGNQGSPRIRGCRPVNAKAPAFTWSSQYPPLIGTAGSPATQLVTMAAVPLRFHVPSPPYAAGHGCAAWPSVVCQVRPACAHQPTNSAMLPIMSSAPYMLTQSFVPPATLPA